MFIINHPALSFHIGSRYAAAAASARAGDLLQFSRVLILPYFNMESKNCDLWFTPVVNVFVIIVFYTYD